MTSDRDDLHEIAATVLDICVTVAKLSPAQTISVFGGAIGMAIATSGVPEMDDGVWTPIKILARAEFERTRDEIAGILAKREIKH